MTLHSIGTCVLFEVSQVLSGSKVSELTLKLAVCQKFFLAPFGRGRRRRDEEEEGGDR